MMGEFFADTFLVLISRNFLIMFFGVDIL